MRNKSTSNSGEKKLERAKHQVINIERLIGSLPKQYNRVLIREIVNSCVDLQEKIRHLENMVDK